MRTAERLYDVIEHRTSYTWRKRDKKERNCCNERASIELSENYFDRFLGHTRSIRARVSICEKHSKGEEETRGMFVEDVTTKGSNVRAWSNKRVTVNTTSN